MIGRDLFKLLAGGLSIITVAGVTACASPEYDASVNDSLLKQAGFQVASGSTLDGQKLLASLPANAATLRDVNGKPTYFFADKIGCGCTYYGSQNNYNAFRSLVIQRNVMSQEELDHLNALDAWKSSNAS